MHFMMAINCNHCLPHNRECCTQIPHWWRRSRKYEQYRQKNINLINCLNC